ncbi:hypothetical protein [Streptomonospora arabica]|uniref:EF-hand domain-containing protein n=1 Tax=Streptomonospora arabica TaxID=412417 RepID=A0ABV9SSQ3_9ACTN
MNLVLQRADQTDERFKEQARILTDYDSRLRTVESTMATQECVRELDARFDGTVTKEEMAQRQSRTRWLVGLMVSVAAIAASVAIGLINVLL